MAAEGEPAAKKAAEAASHNSKIHISIYPEIRSKSTLVASQASRAVDHLANVSPSAKLRQHNYSPPA